METPGDASHQILASAYLDAHQALPMIGMTVEGLTIVEEAPQASVAPSTGREEKNVLGAVKIDTAEIRARIARWALRFEPFRTIARALGVYPGVKWEMHPEHRMTGFRMELSRPGRGTFYAEWIATVDPESSPLRPTSYYRCRVVVWYRETLVPHEFRAENSAWAKDVCEHLARSWWQAGSRWHIHPDVGIPAKW